MRHDPDTVTASEIAEFVYCPEAWRLRQTGAPSANRAEHAAGTIHHQEKATAQQIAGGSIVIGRILIVDGLIALTVLWALSPMTPWLIAIAALVVEILLLQGGRGMRQRRGLGRGRTTGLGNRTLYSSRFGLTGRPDRMMDRTIPEECKSGSRVYDSHCAQLGAYFLLIEEETGIRPTDGFISLESGERVRIENTDQLMAWVLGVAEQIRAARREIGKPIPVRQTAAKCRGVK